MPYTLNSNNLHSYYVATLTKGYVSNIYMALEELMWLKAQWVVKLIWRPSLKLALRKLAYKLVTNFVPESICRYLFMINYR